MPVRPKQWSRKKTKKGLSASDMAKSWGGKQPEMRDTVVSEGDLGPFEHEQKLKIGDTQCFTYGDSDDGPFYLTVEQREAQKNDHPTGAIKKHKKNIAELLEEFECTHGFQLQNKKYRRAEVEQLAKQFNTPLIVEIPVISEGWTGKRKGLLQVLWERGFIDTNQPLSNYTLDGKKSHRDENGNVKPEFQCFALRLTEKSAIKNLVEDLTVSNSFVEILVTPKKGLSMDGLCKKHYRSLPQADKRTKAKFHQSVMESLPSLLQKGTPLHDCIPALRFSF